MQWREFIDGLDRMAGWVQECCELFDQHVKNFSLDSTGGSAEDELIFVAVRHSINRDLLLSDSNEYAFRKLVAKLVEQYREHNGNSDIVVRTVMQFIREKTGTAT